MTGRGKEERAKFADRRLRIIKGELATIRAFPWMARLSIMRGDRTQLLCGAVLIESLEPDTPGSSQLIATSAHCVYKYHVAVLPEV